MVKSKKSPTMEEEFIENMRASNVLRKIEAIIDYVITPYHKEVLIENTLKSWRNQK